MKMIILYNYATLQIFSGFLSWKNLYIKKFSLYQEVQSLQLEIYY